MTKITFNTTDSELTDVQENSNTSINTSTNTIASTSTKEDILDTLTPNEDSNIMLKDILSSLISTFVEIYNSKNEDKISE